MVIEEANVVLRTKSSEIHEYAHNIVAIRFLSDKLVLLDEAMEIDDILTSLMMNEKKFVLLNALDIQSNMNTASQRYFAKQSQLRLRTLGVAILLNNLPIRLTASVFIKFQKPPYATKIFGTEIDALNWFEKMRD